VTNGVIIRPESESDRQAIRVVHRAAFGQEDEALLVDNLRESEAFLPELSLVAELEASIVGHVVLSRAQLDDRPVLALGPIGVVPTFQHHGIGAALMRSSLERALGLGEELVVLLGHPEYYPRFGFVPASRLGIKPPRPWSDAAFMALELRPGAARGGGAFAYPAAFVLD
jgi:putative acetyltransferase